MKDGTKKELEKIEEPQEPILVMDHFLFKFGSFFVIVGLALVVAGIGLGNECRSRLLVIIGIISGGFNMIVGCFVIKMGMEEKQEKHKQYGEQLLEHKIAMEKYNAYNLYRYCVNKNIDIQDEKAIAIVSNNFSVPREEIIKVFNKGKKYAEELNYKKNVDRITSEKQKEKEEYDAIYENTKVVGKDKYLAKKYKELEQNLKMADVCGQGKDRCVQLSQTRAKTSDWAILGGMANGIAGPAAGLATAYNVQQKNAEAEREAEAIRNQAFDNIGYLWQQQSQFEYSAHRLQEYIEEVNNRLYDESDPEEKMKLIHAMVQNYKILDTKNMRICLKFDCEKEIHILNSEALIDGSIQINILKNREIVGTTYYCAPGFDKNAVARTVTGFGAVSESETIALGSFEEGIDYEFEIKPYKLWCIER